MQTKKQSTSFEKLRLQQLVQKLEKAGTVNYLTLLEDFKAPYNQMHQKLDQILLFKIQQQINPDVPQGEEEDKCTDLKTEAKSLKKEGDQYKEQLSSLISEDLSQVEKSKELIDRFEKHEWNANKAGILDVGVQVAKEVHFVLSEWKYRAEEEADAYPSYQLRDRPLSQCLVKALTSLKKKLKHPFKDSFEKLKKNITHELQTTVLQDFLANVGLEQLELYQEMKRIEAKCDAEMKEIIGMNRDLNPSQNLKKALELGKLETEADIVKSSHFLTKEQEKKICKFSGYKIKELLYRPFEIYISPNSQNISEYLYQPESGSQSMHIFSIKEKKMGIYKLEHNIPPRMGFCCCENLFYAAGGLGDVDFLKTFSKIDHLGTETKLSDMATEKGDFPLVFWRNNRSLIAVGGRNKESLKLVQQYSITSEKWSALEDLLFATYGSSAIIYQNVLYNIGGDGYSHSGLFYPLLSPMAKWIVFNFKESAFRGFVHRDAAVLDNKIIYFGDRCISKTYIIERISEELQVNAELEGFDYQKGDDDASFCIFQNKIYAFESNSYYKISTFDLGTLEWNQFY